jgi:hypothetical protein
MELPLKALFFSKDSNINQKLRLQDHAWCRDPEACKLSRLPVRDRHLQNRAPVFTNWCLLPQPWRGQVTDLYDWFSRQHHGLRTYQLFRQKLGELSKNQPEKRALYALLSQLAVRYIEAFDEQPIPTAVADRAYQGLLTLLASLDRSPSADGKLADLNRVAATDLLAPISEVARHNPPAGTASRLGIGF